MGPLLEGERILFTASDGALLSGVISHVELSNGEWRFVAGQLLQPAPGRFFFQKQDHAGLAGAYTGLLELPKEKRAYRLEPAAMGSASEFVPHPWNEVLCFALPRPVPPRKSPAGGKLNLSPDDFPAVPIPVYQTGIVVLESLPGSTPVIYLDFQGGSTPTWGGIQYLRSAYNNSDIRDIWRRVSEDFLPFNINVTTDLKVFQNAPPTSRQRVIITPTDTADPGAGGVAYVGSFNWDGDVPCWVFVTEGSSYCAQACSHEAGHTLGLIHCGQILNGTNVEYYYGHGAGETGCGPNHGRALLSKCVSVE